IPAVTCSDGWKSPSIGRMGACSHHGGVKNNGWFYLVIGGISWLVGSATSNLFARNNTDSSLPTETSYHPFSVEIELILAAIKNRKTIQFLYKGSKESNYMKRTVKPIEVV